MEKKDSALDDDDQSRTDGTADTKKETGTAHRFGEERNDPHEVYFEWLFLDQRNVWHPQGHFVEATTQKMEAERGQEDKEKTPQYGVDHPSISDTNEASGSGQIRKHISNAKSQNGQVR